jgi:hypothetical protein
MGSYSFPGLDKKWKKDAKAEKKHLVKKASASSGGSSGGGGGGGSGFAKLAAAKKGDFKARLASAVAQGVKEYNGPALPKEEKKAPSDTRAASGPFFTGKPWQVSGEGKDSAKQAVAPLQKGASEKTDHTAKIAEHVAEGQKHQQAINALKEQTPKGHEDAIKAHAEAANLHHWSAQALREAGQGHLDPDEKKEVLRRGENYASSAKSIGDAAHAKSQQMLSAAPDKSAVEMKGRENMAQMSEGDLKAKAAVHQQGEKTAKDLWGNDRAKEAHNAAYDEHSAAEKHHTEEQDKLIAKGKGASTEAHAHGVAAYHHAAAASAHDFAASHPDGAEAAHHLSSVAADATEKAKGAGRAFSAASQLRESQKKSASDAAAHDFAEKRAGAGKDAALLAKYSGEKPYDAAARAAFKAPATKAVAQPKASQTGKRGGQYYTTATGQKVYIGKKG